MHILAKVLEFHCLESAAIISSAKFAASLPSSSASRESLRQGDVADLDIFVTPLVEELDGTNLISDLLGQNGVARNGLDFDFSAVRHDGDD